jgi:hypothetical protein
MSNSVDSDQPCFTKVHNWLARLRFRDRARPEPKWPLVTRLLGEPLSLGERSRRGCCETGRFRNTLNFWPKRRMGVTKEVVGTHICRMLSLFVGGILRSLLPRVPLVNAPFAHLQF